MTILVSVVIPTYGRAEALGKAIESVLGQTYKDLEVIIVDDNDPSSKDRSATRSIVEGYMAVDGRVRYVELERNVGGSLARNAGVEASVGELVTFLDDDDFYLPTKVERQVSAFEASGCDICTCSMIPMDGGKVARYIRSVPNGLNLREFLLDGWAFTPMIMVRRSVFIAAGGFVDTPRFQDLLLMLRLLCVTSRHFILDEPLFVHNMYLGGRVSQSSKLRKAYVIRHRLENELSGCLTDPELVVLRKRQELDLYDCDIFESRGFGRILIIYRRLLSASSLSDFVFLVRFSLKKAFRRSSFVWWLRRKIFSA